MASPGLIDSRLGVGTLKLGTSPTLTDYSFQVANCALEPDISDEDGTPTLAVPDPAPLATVAWNLTGTVIQDFTGGPTSFLNFLMDNALAEKDFEFVPDTDDGTKFSGKVQIRPAPIGGDAGVQITSDFELPVVGQPTRTDGTTTASASRAPSKAS